MIRFTEEQKMILNCYEGVISWMIGSMAKPCISQWNCSADKDLSSVEERGHVK